MFVCSFACLLVCWLASGIRYLFLIRKQIQILIRNKMNEYTSFNNNKNNNTNAYYYYYTYK